MLQVPHATGRTVICRAGSDAELGGEVTEAGAWGPTSDWPLKRQAACQREPDCAEALFLETVGVQR